MRKIVGVFLLIVALYVPQHLIAEQRNSDSRPNLVMIFSDDESVATRVVQLGKADRNSIV